MPDVRQNRLQGHVRESRRSGNGSVGPTSKYIYHYTTQAGLYGILDTQTLHATHYRYLNDASEMEQLKGRLSKQIIGSFRHRFDAAVKGKSLRLTPTELELTLAMRARDFIKKLYDTTFGIGIDLKVFQPFIASFCGHEGQYEKANGLLSQWRGYGRDSGYAIILRTQDLWRMVAEHEGKRYAYTPYLLKNVVYESEKDVFENEFKELAGALDRAIREGLGGPATEALFPQFTDAIARYKHGAFAEEREVRMLLSPPEVSKLLKPEEHAARGLYDKQIHFRDNLVPYIILFEGMNVTLPVERIIVGPHREKELRTEKLKRYLEMKGLKIEVHCSETPLV